MASPSAAMQREGRNEKMKPDDVANAITQALVEGGSQWMVVSIVAFLPALWSFAQIFTSNHHPVAALWIMWLSMAGMGLVAGWLFVRVWMAATRSMGQRLAKQESAQPPQQEPTAVI